MQQAAEKVNQPEMICFPKGSETNLGSERERTGGSQDGGHPGLGGRTRRTRFPGFNRATQLKDSQGRR